MTIYNFNKGIGWASSGVEYAQAYRSNMFKKNGQRAKFIFTDMFYQNLEPMTKNIGFEDDEIIWLYQFFTDIAVRPTTYSLEELVATFPSQPDKVIEGEVYISYYFEDNNLVIHAFIDKNAQEQAIYKTETIVGGKLIQRDYYSYVKVFSEYYKPVKNQANLYQRRFFNEDGSMVYDEVLNGKQSLYIFEDRTIYSFENLIIYFIECLSLTSKDILILDRATDIGAAIFKSKGPAKLGVVVHAEHFNEPLTNENYILWNNYYDYQFKNANLVDFFICATEKQKEIIVKQFEIYKKGNIDVRTIPVGSIDQLQYDEHRQSSALITASRLASEKHIDWLVEAVVEARKTIKDLTLDIYGEGGEKGMLKHLISKYNAESYIQLKGQQNLTKVYKQYKTYIAASTSEGFGLSLLEAIGSGLAMIGFNVRYGNQTFIKNGRNGYLIEYTKNNKILNIQNICQAIIDIHQLSSEERKNFEKISYEIAQPFLTQNIQDLWFDLEKDIIND